MREDLSFFYTTFISGLMISGSGVAMFCGALLHRKLNFDWTWWLFEGLFDTIIGVFIISRPGESAIVYQVLIALWALLTGICLIITAIHLHYYLIHRTLFYIPGIAITAAGIIFTFAIGNDFYSLNYYYGLFGLICGALLLLMSLQLKQIIVEEFDEDEECA